jgi:hypothetical protein
MTINDEITIIANQLANQGKKPSVALVKTRLGSRTPLPTIISALKNWTHDPEFIESKNKAEQKSQNNTAPSEVSPAVNKAIKQALLPIEVELAEIKALLFKLQNK